MSTFVDRYLGSFLYAFRHHRYDFRSRSTAREYWMFMFAVNILSTVLTLLMWPLAGVSAMMPMLGGGSGFSGAAGQATPLILLVVVVIAAVLLIIPSLAITVRRLHDTGRSGWFILIGFVPYLGWLVVTAMLTNESEVGANRWGPDPYGDAGDVEDDSAG